MKDLSMDIEWRTVQLFLGSEGISEVQIDHENHVKLRCSCAEFNKIARCKHTRHVRAAMKENEGHYSIEIPEMIEDAEAIVAMLNADTFRDFVIKYGKVKVIE